MAGYGYKNMGYVTQEKGRSGTRIQPYGSPYNGVEERSDQWRNTGFAPNSEGCQDHRCTPVRVTGYATNYDGRQDHRCTPVSFDAEGQKNMIVACTPDENTQYVVTKRETIVEHGPVVTRYKVGFPTSMGATIDYGIIDNEWSSPVSPSHERPPIVDEFISKVQIEASRPARMGPTKDYGTNHKEWSSPVNLSRERPPIVDEFISKVQTEPSRPARMGPLNGRYWRRTPNPPNHGGTNGYSDPKGYYETVPKGTQEPAVITTGGWTRPSRVGWATPPSYESPLGKPTNDIGTAVEYIKEAIKPPSDTTFTTGYRFTEPPPAAPGVKFSPTPVIDSKEAARRYKGTIC